MSKKQQSKGKQGFASMDEEKQREIASKAGKTAHKGEQPDAKDESEDEDNENEGQSKRGFASMDKEKVREIASKGGKSSHRGSAEEDEGEEDGVSEKIYSLVDILQEDLTAVDIDTATAAIDEWYQQLQGSKDKDLKKIATSLKNLRKLVTSDEADESAIAEILISMGEQIGEYASNADENISDSLQELSVALTDAGESLE